MTSALRIGLIRHGLALLLFLLMALWTIYPVLDQPRAEILGWPGDNILYAYMTGRMAQAVSEGQSPFTDPHANYPDSLPMAANEAPFLSMALMIPITWLAGPIFSYNSIIFLNALLSGIFMYLWVYRITGSRFGGAVAGMLFILTPYRVVRNYGHLNLVSIQVLPLFFWALDTMLRHPIPGRRQCVALGGATFLVGCMSQYYLVICALTGFAYYGFGSGAGWLRAASAGAPARPAIWRRVRHGIAARRYEWLVAAAGLMLWAALGRGGGYERRLPSHLPMEGDLAQVVRGPLSDRERVADGTRSFRWTLGEISLHFPHTGGGSGLLSLGLYTRHPDGSPTTAIVRLGSGRQLHVPDAEHRVIRIFVPSSAASGLVLASNLYLEPSASARRLGIVVFDLGYQPLGARFRLLGWGLGACCLLSLSGAALSGRLAGSGWRPAAGAGAAGMAATLGLQGASAFAMPWPLILAGGLWALAALLAVGRSLRRWQILRGQLSYALAAGCGAVLSASPYLITKAQSGDYKAYPIETTRWLSASPENFLVPSHLHPLFGAWVDQHIPLANRLEGGWIEHTAYLGIVTLVLALSALLWRRTPYRRRLWIWLGTISIALIGAFGTDLHIGGRAVSESEPVWLPMYYLGRLPVLNLMRVWARFSIVVIVLVTAMAGIGAAQIYRKLRPARRRAAAFAIGTVVLALLDLAPGRLETFVLAPRPIDRWLAQQPGDFAAAFLPAGVDPLPALFGTLTHKKRIPAFNHGQHRPPAFDDFARRAATFPADASLRLLQDMRLRYLLINLARYSDEDRRRIKQSLASTPHGRIIAQVDGWTVFALQ